MKQFIAPFFEKDVAGVYRIKFSTGHFYIGGSVNIRCRIDQWKTRLKYGIRKNIDMLSVYEASSSIVFDIIEVVADPEQVLHREDFYIKLFWGVDKFLNKSPSAFTNLGSTQSEGRIRVKSAILQPVAKVDNNGVVLEMYESVADCAKANDVKVNLLRRSYKKIGLTCFGNTYRKIAPDGSLIMPPHIPNKPRRKGYHISMEARERKAAAMQRRKENGTHYTANQKQVSQFTLDGGFIKNHPSISDAAKAIGLKDERRLRKLLNGREGKSIYKFIFKFLH